MDVRRSPLGVLIMVPVIAGFGLYAFTTQDAVVDPNATPTTTATADASATATIDADMLTAIAADRAALDSEATAWASMPTATAIPPTPAPMAQRGDFREGAVVTVNAGEGDCLNARNQPSLQNEYVIVQNCLPHGFEGYITGEAIEADGYWWWYLAGTGWVAEDYLVVIGERDLRTAAPALADLADRIAFFRDGDIWVMNADASDQRMVEDTPVEPDSYLQQDLRWSPDGTMLSYNVSRTVDGGEPQTFRTTTDLHVLDVPADGLATSRVFENAFGGGWSPDSTRTGIIAEPALWDMGSGAAGVPALLDVRDGGRLVYGSQRASQQDAPTFNHDGTLLLLTYQAMDGGSVSGEAAILVWDLDGNEVHRIAQPAGNAFYSRPRWSPVADQIAFHVSEYDETTQVSSPRYVVYDISAGAIIDSVASPRASEKIGGGCGGGDMWRMEWSRDGRRLLYDFSMGETGANGVWVWDVAIGDQRVIPAAQAGPASPAAGGWFAFAASGSYSSSGPSSYIFAGNDGGGAPLLLTDGSQPAWWSE